MSNSYLSNLSIDGLICIEIQTISDWPYLALYRLKQLFSHCSISTEDNKLFYCNESKQFISKYRIEDYIEDCYHGEDER